MKKLLLLTALSTLAACTSTSQRVELKDYSYLVSKGMTQQQVIEKVGIPANKEIRKKGDVFVYNRTVGWKRDFYVCFGDKGKVSETGYYGHPSGLCYKD